MTEKKWIGEYNDFVGVYHKIISSDICNEYLEFYNWEILNNYSKTSWKPGSNEFMPDGTVRRDESIKSPVKYLSGQDDNYIESFPDSLSQKYFSITNNCLQEYITHYTLPLDIAIMAYFYKIHKVESGQGYHQWHCECDPQKSPNRMFAYMTYLQAPESGGETEFLHQSLRITPEVGTTLIWPAYFTHMHRGNPPLKGTKIYLTGWFHATGFVPSGTPKL